MYGALASGGCSRQQLLQFLRADAQLQREPRCRLPIWLLLKCYTQQLGAARDLLPVLPEL